MRYGTKIRGQFPLGPYVEGMTGLDFVRAGFDNFEHWDRPMLCQEKLDGWFGIVVRGDGDCYWDNGWKQYKALQAMLPRFNEFMPHGSILVGEVGYGTEKETRLAEKNGFNRFVAYDVLMWGGAPLVYGNNEDRFNVLKEAIRVYKLRVTSVPAIDIANTVILGGTPEVNKAVAWQEFTRIHEEGGEGIVLKELHGKYAIRGDSKSMYKVKKFMTKDYVCMGFTRSVAPTYLEQGLTVAAMECGLLVDGKVVQVTQTAGFDFEWRKKFSDEPEKYIGRVVELGGFEIFPSGAMRHSSFLRFRDDRSIQDCVL
jgi:hypothetical protein